VGPLKMNQAKRSGKQSSALFVYSEGYAKLERGLSVSQAMGMLDAHTNLEEGSHVQTSHERGLGIYCAGRRLGPDIRTTELLTTPPFRHQNLGARRRLVADGPFAGDSRHHGRHGTDCVEFVGRCYLLLFAGKQVVTEA